MAFFIFMDLTIIITSEYMYEQLIGFDTSPQKKRFLLSIIWMMQAFDRLLMRLPDFTMKNIMARATRTDWLESRFLFMQGSWQLQMYSTPFLKNAATGMR